MELCFHKGDNFGDALNPIIFNKLLPGVFDGNRTEIFIGIGSILGLKKGYPETRKKYVFSSGFAANKPDTYGTLPQIDQSYEILCVRGPLTAKALNIPETKAVTDGAILVRNLITDCPKKEYEFAYMPHLSSFFLYDRWDKLLKRVGVKLIDPRKNPLEVLNEIQKTEVLLSEAMHGAIVADALRVPWIPIKSNKAVNEFKWIDFTKSLELDYNPVRIETLYNKQVLKGILKNKNISFGLDSIGSNMYLFYQNNLVNSKVLSGFKYAKQQKPFLSKDVVTNERYTQLLEILDSFKHGLKTSGY